MSGIVGVMTNAKTIRATGWAVLFLLSPSPGRVFRYLERNCLDGGDAAALPNLLSDPAPPHGWRALTGSGTSPTHLEELGKQLSGVFPPRVTLLWATANRRSWGYMAWEQETEVERGGSSSDNSRSPSLLSRLAGSGLFSAASSPAADWAAARGLPLARVPNALPRNRPATAVPMVEYVAVATLDQRSLLVENAPRLYRFDYAPPPGDKDILKT